MKEQIIKLRSEGLSYLAISRKLGCSKSTVSYHCGDKQKEKAKARNRNYRKTAVIDSRVGYFQYNRKLKDKADDFQRDRLPNRRLGKRKLSFSWRDVIDKFGWYTKCYLTGRPINLREPETYQFDHIIPLAKGGPSTLDNLGIACKDANQIKNILSVTELFAICKEVLEYNGYKVTEPNSSPVTISEERV
jgi:5-methylcytosine-specific restriction endonuclease McrA